MLCVPWLIVDPLQLQDGSDSHFFFSFVSQQSRQVSIPSWSSRRLLFKPKIWEETECWMQKSSTTTLIDFGLEADIEGMNPLSLCVDLWRMSCKRWSLNEANKQTNMQLSRHYMETRWNYDFQIVWIFSKISSIGMFEWLQKPAGSFNGRYIFPKGTISIGNTSSNDWFSGAMLVLGRVIHCGMLLFTFLFVQLLTPASSCLTASGCLTVGAGHSFRPRAI